MGLFTWMSKPAVAFSMTSVAAGMMNSVFSFYYVKIFLDQYHVSQSWFNFSQVVFMVWNAINDPLFGYIQDNFNFSWVKSRRHSILYGAPLYAISFLIPWFPWADFSDEKNSWICGFQLLFALSFYDTMLTFVLLAQCSLFTELSHKQEDRIQLVRFAQLGSLIGSTGVFFCNVFSNNLNNMFKFQVTCVIIAIIAWRLMSHTGLHCHTEYDLDTVVEKVPKKPPDSSDNVILSAWRQVREIFTQSSFVSFVFMNFCQIFHMTYLMNFMKIIIEEIIGAEYFSNEMKSVVYGASNLLPQILVIIIGSTLLHRVGYYNIIKGSFIVNIVLGLGLYMSGPNPIPLLIFFLADSVSACATFSLFNLPLSDVIDEDKRKYNRIHPLSSTVFGTNALITKPAQSLAPMFAVAIFSDHGYKSDLSNQSASLTLPVNEDLQSIMFTVTCWLPVIISFVQLLIWSRYTIRNSHRIVSEYVESGN